MNNDGGSRGGNLANGGPFGMTTSSPPLPQSTASTAAPLLDIAQLTMRFGGIVALENVSFTVRQGRIAGLIGPNGAGKTTLFNCLSRLYRPERGDIRLNGRSLRRCAARSEEHTSERQSHVNLVCRLLLEKKKK